MGLDPSVEEQELLEDTLARSHRSTSPRERAAGGVLLGGLIAACITLLLVRTPGGHFAVFPALACVLTLALAARIWFETPLGFTVPTQLAFVPLLFTMPVALVPPAVAVALVVARLPEVLRGKTTLERLLYTPANAWFAIGPVAVFVIAGVQPRQASAGILVLALLGQFAADSAANLGRFMIERNARLREQLLYAWVYPVDAAFSGVGLVVALQMAQSAVALLSLLPLLAILAFFARERHGRLVSLLELKNAYRGTALVLGDVVEADDGYTGQHSKSVVQLAVEVAHRLNLNADRLRNTEFGALLHDVGKIAIPKHILNKPGRLDPEEWTIIQTHTIQGQKMLERVGGFMREVGMIVRSHHERWDGTGYPDGLVGDAIPLESRIISACDTWNAMRTNRSYRKALSYEVAMAELLAASGTQLDPAVVQALVEVVRPQASRAATPAEGAQPSASTSSAAISTAASVG